MKFLPTAIRTLYPFANNGHHYHAIGSHFMHFVDEGQAKSEAVLMLHGNPTWSFFYRNLILKLRDSFRCIAPDHMGCGLSDKPQDYPYTLKTHIDNANSLLNHLDVKKVHLIVHDWGGAIGMGLALRRPERIGKIVLLNTAAFPSTRIPKRIRACRAPILGPLMVQGLNAFVRGALSMATENRMETAIRQAYRFPYSNWRNRIALMRFVQDIPLETTHPSFPVLKQIEEGLRFLQKPTLICWGEKDFCFNGHFLAEWERRWPHATVKRFSNAGHYILEDAGEAIAREVATFLA